MDLRRFNRDAWNRQVEDGNPWTIAVSSEEIARARAGDWHIVLTPTIPVPADWFPRMDGAQILCLASGGGQQGPILAAAGARVTVYDNSPRQLGRDREVADREGLDIETVEGDMRDLSCFSDDTFDLIVHPVSNTFVPEIRPVWREAWRVLKPGGALLAGFDNPLMHLFDVEAWDRGELIVANKLPYSDIESLSKETMEQYEANGRPLEFGHTLDDQIGGQIDCGFLITGFYEDRDPDDILSQYIPSFIATRAVKPQ